MACESIHGAHMDDGLKLTILQVDVEMPNSVCQRILSTGHYTYLNMILYSICGYATSLVENGAQQFYEDGFYYTDSTVLEVFDFGLKEGDPASAQCPSGA